jgi:hypothetical protein
MPQGEGHFKLGEIIPPQGGTGVIRPRRIPIDAAESRCRQWEEICGPILDFLQTHPEVVGARAGDSLTQKLLVFLKQQVKP